MNLRVSERQTMQHKFLNLHPKWGGTPPSATRSQLLWSIGEIGETIDVIKKRDNDEIVHNLGVRRHFIEEMVDARLVDVLLYCDITAEEFSDILALKHKRSMKRNFAQQHQHPLDDSVEANRQLVEEQP